MSVMKTKSAAERVGVNPTTIQRWIKYLQLDVKKNHLGHYLFTEADIDGLQAVKNQLDSGLSLSDLEQALESEDQSALAESLPVKPVPVESVTMEKEDSSCSCQEQIEQLKRDIVRLQKDVSQKADEVIMVQVLQHRSEIDEAMRTVRTLAQRVENLEERLLKPVQQQPEMEQPVTMMALEPKKVKRKWLASIFNVLLK